MNLFFEQNVYILIVVFLRETLGKKGLQNIIGSWVPYTTFETPAHGLTTRHIAFHSRSDSSSDEYPLKHVKNLKNVAHFGDAQHRGPDWYDFKSNTDNSNSFDKKGSGEITTTSSSSSSQSRQQSGSSEASSFETKEIKLETRVYRTCTPCPHDMLKKYKNMGIKWICGGYQRARRSFKSECMMRYRNCQDGTLFVKMFDHKCPKDKYHGRHFFYHYRV